MTALTNEDKSLIAKIMELKAQNDSKKSNSITAGGLSAIFTFPAASFGAAELTAGLSTAASLPLTVVCAPVAAALFGLTVALMAQKNTRQITTDTAPAKIDKLISLFNNQDTSALNDEDLTFIISLGEKQKVLTALMEAKNNASKQPPAVPTPPATQI